MSKKTYYNPEWEDPQKYPEFSIWITKGKDVNTFSCKFCGCTLALGNMAMGTLKKHMGYEILFHPILLHLMALLGMRQSKPS